MAYKYPFRFVEEATKLAVWRKATPIPGYDPAVWRRDKYGHAMKYSEHGNTNSEYGWEMDHIQPVVRGGSDDLGNLQPLYWATNRNKGDSYPF